MHMVRILRPLRRALAAVGAAVTVAAMTVAVVTGAAQAQDDPAAPGGLTIDESVDQSLGVLQPLSPIGGLLSFRMLLQLPEDPFAFRGPQPFDQQPPAAQSDFSDPSEPVDPRGGKLK